MSLADYCRFESYPGAISGAYLGQGTPPQPVVTILKEPVQLSAQLNASRGAAYLDKVRPGWYRQINLDTLRLSDAGCCILAQVYRKPYDMAAEAAGLTLVTVEKEPDLRMIDLGFFVNNTLKGWQETQDAWVAEIGTRIVAEERHAESETASARA